MKIGDRVRWLDHTAKRKKYVVLAIEGDTVTIARPGGQRQQEVRRVPADHLKLCSESGGLA
jgi:hypothetical protein